MLNKTRPINIRFSSTTSVHCNTQRIKSWSLDVRLSALLHDVSKPESRRKHPVTGEWTFYGHEVVGSRVTRKILKIYVFLKKLSKKSSKWYVGTCFLVTLTKLLFLLFVE